MPEQKKEKPRIEDIASDYLEGEALENVLDFVTWLRANKMTPTFGSKSKIGISYTTHVCYLKLFHGHWWIWISGKHRKHKHGYVDDFLACAELKEIVSKDLAQCIEGCGHKCNGGQGYTVTVCGETYHKVCGCCTVRFRSPNAETLDIIKEVIQKRNDR